MANLLFQTIKELRKEIARISSLVSSLKVENSKLKSENEDLRRRLSQQEENLKKALSDVDFLTVSHRLADNPDALISSRRHIARLIRNLDTAISMLKE